MKVVSGMAMSSSSLSSKRVRRISVLALPLGLQAFDNDDLFARRSLGAAVTCCHDNPASSGVSTPFGSELSAASGALTIAYASRRKLEVAAERVEMPPPPPKPHMHHERSADVKFQSGLASVAVRPAWNVYASMTPIDVAVDLRSKLARKRRFTEKKQVRSFDTTVDCYYWEDGKSRDDTREHILLYVPMRGEPNLAKEHVTVTFGERSVALVVAVPQQGGKDGEAHVHTYRLKLEPLSHAIDASKSKFSVRAATRTIVVRMKKSAADLELPEHRKWYGLTPSSAVPPPTHLGVKGRGGPDRIGVARELENTDNIRQGPGRHQRFS